MKTGALVICLALIGCVSQFSRKNERYYQEKWCLAHGGQMEVVMPDRTRCDCLTDRHAVEFDFAKKWAEAIGQALNYARQTGKQPGIVIICEKKTDRKKLLRVRLNADFYKLPVRIWSINCGDKN